MFQLNKTLVSLAFFAIAVSQSWAAPCLADGQKVFCKWTSSAGCWQVNSQPLEGAKSTCAIQAGYCTGSAGTLYSGGSENSGTCEAGGNVPYTCNGCVWSEEGDLVWCHYIDGETGADGGCYEKTATECAAGHGTPVTSCSNTPGGGGGTEYCKWGDGAANCNLLTDPNALSTDPANEGMTNREVCIYFSQGIFNNSACTGTPVAGGPNAPQKGQCADAQGRGLFCNWTGNCIRLSTNEVQTTCPAAIANCGSRTYWGVDGTQLTEANGWGNTGPACAAIGGQPHIPAGSSSSNNNSSSSSSSSSSGGGETGIMISKIADANGMQLIKNGVSLQVTKNATLEVFDLHGNRLRKLSFSDGSWSVPLSDLPKGLYIVKVSFGHSREILRVPIK